MMNNYEWVQNSKSLEDLGYDLCELTDIEKGDCDCCPVSNLCEPGLNGYIEWLKKEHIYHENH